MFANSRGHWIPQNDSELDKRQLSTTAVKLMRFSKACIDLKLMFSVCYWPMPSGERKQKKEKKKMFSLKT